MDARLQEFRLKEMQSVKDLYHSRHYTQCAKFAEQLLAETNETQLHPIHLTYLHFYTALSHDTLAREATLRNRHKELNLAETHYLAAITALTPPLQAPKQPQQDERNDSPISPTCHAPHLWQRHSSDTGSFDSAASAASSATSYSHGRDEEERDASHKRGESFQFPRPPGVDDHLRGEGKATRHHNTIYISTYTSSPLAGYTTATHDENEYRDDLHTTNANATYPDFPLASQTSSFLTLLSAHLTSVRSLKIKSSVHTVRFTIPPPKPSATAVAVAAAAAARDKARASMVYDEVEAQRVRQMRRNKVFRERFNPEGVRRLCGDVLAELS